MDLLNKYLVVLTLLLSGTAYSQDQGTFDNLYNKAHPEYRAFFVKGKVMPWLLIGAGVTYSAGFEYAFNHNNAFEVSAVYNDYSIPTEVLDTAIDAFVPGPRTYTVNRAIFGIYKRYFQMKIFNPTVVKPYSALFYRYAKIHEYYQPGAPTNSIQFDQWEHSIGYLQGFLFNLKDGGVLDLSAGVFYKRKYSERLSESNGFQFSNESLRYNIGVRLGLNFGIGWIWKKKVTMTSTPIPENTGRYN